MIGFLNKSLLAALVLSAGSAVALPASAPHDTAPSLDRDMDGDDTAEQPAADGGTVAVEPQGAISETSVSAPPIDGFGTLEQGKDGALPEDIWKGSERATTDPLLKAMHSGVANPTLQGLLVNLLMTQATPPQGSAPQGWFSLRVSALVGMGQDEKAEQMIASLPPSMTDASLMQLQAGLQLIRGQYDQACQKASPESLPQDADGEGFWRKLSILCQAHAGKQDEAMVGIDLMREERHTDDQFFQEAIRRIGDKNSPIHAGPKQWSLLNVALLRLSEDREWLKSGMDAFPPVALKYLAQDATLDAKLREKAQARARQIGVLPQPEGDITPEQPFSRAVASDVTTLVAALGSGKPANEDDDAVIARLALDSAGVNDGRRIQRLLTLMEPFGYRVPPEIWAKLFLHKERFDGEVPPASWVARINEAAAGGRRGEVILLAALIAGDADVDKVTDLALLPVIKALMAAGFGAEARAIAHDAVKSYSVH